MKSYLGVVDTTGKILRDVTDSNGLPVSLTGSIAQTVKPFNAVNINIGSSSTEAAFRNVSSFRDIGWMLMIDASANRGMDFLWSHDGINYWVESVLTAVVGTNAGGRTTKKAKFLKLIVYNNDAGLAHTVSVWLDLIP